MRDKHAKQDQLWNVAVVSLVTEAHAAVGRSMAGSELSPPYIGCARQPLTSRRVCSTGLLAGHE